MCGIRFSMMPHARVHKPLACIFHNEARDARLAVGSQPSFIGVTLAEIGDQLIIMYS
jgi:hypothetical protein